MSRRDDIRAAFGIDRFRPARPAPRGRSQEEHLALDRPGKMLARLGGIGLRPALLLALCIVVPPAFAVLRHAAEGHPGVPVTLGLLVVAGSALAGALLAGVTPSPRLGQLLTRGLVLAVVAFLVRLFTPSFGAAIEAIGDGRILAVPFGRTFALLAVAHAAGHDVAARVARAAEGAATRPSERADEEMLLTLWLASTTVTVVALGIFGGPAGFLGALFGLVGVVGGGLVIAAIRVSASPPGGRRRAVVAVSRRLRLGVIAGSLGVAIVVAAAITPLLPPTVTEATPRLIAWITEGDFDGELPSWWFPPDDGERVTEPGDEGGVLDADRPERQRVPDRQLSLTPLIVTLGVIVLGVLALLVRGRDWRETWRTLLAWLFAAGGRRPAAGYETVEGLERPDRDRRRRSGLRGRFRPRDPRGAVLFDYLRAERALRKHDLGREDWETPLEHADRLGIGAEHRELADLASDARYGRREPDPASSERSRELSRRVVRVARDAEDRGSTEVADRSATRG